MQVQVSPQTLKQICHLIAEQPYRGGPRLVEFFNDLGWQDEYPEALKPHSRTTYTKDKLEQLNEQRNIYLAIYKATDPRLFINNEEQLENIVTELNRYLLYDGLVLVREKLAYKLKRLPGSVNFQAPVKNIIFASSGPKPEIILKDALSNQIEIVENAQYCLVFDGDTSDGVTWNALVDWWMNLTKSQANRRTAEESLYRRLLDAVPDKKQSPAQFVFKGYYTLLKQSRLLPALLPEVYLHFDPKTLIERNGKKFLNRQRMDFLLLLPGDNRIVIEVDGQHHYASGNVADPQRYGEMVKEDRELRLLGYEVYRFGAIELNEAQGESLAARFFERLLRKYKILQS